MPSSSHRLERWSAFQRDSLQANSLRELTMTAVESKKGFLPEFQSAGDVQDIQGSATQSGSVTTAQIAGQLQGRTPKQVCTNVVAYGNIFLPCNPSHA